MAAEDIKTLFFSAAIMMISIIIEIIASDVLSITDSLILYNKNDAGCTSEEFDAFFSRISLLAVPVTNRFIEDDLSNLARAYNFNGEWLYRKNLFEDAVNNFSCAFKIVTRGNVENALYNDLLFASKVARNIGDSFVELKVYMAAYNAYSKGYSLLSDMYERNIGDKAHLLTYLSELSELLGDTAVFLRSNNRAENIMDPFDLFKNAIDVEVSLYDLTGDKKHYMERRDKLIKKMV